GLGPLAVHGREPETRLRVGEEVRIKLPIETERLVIRPLELEDADDLGEAEEWIREKIDRSERDGGMSLWAAVERESGRAVAVAAEDKEQARALAVAALGRGPLGRTTALRVNGRSTPWWEDYLRAAAGSHPDVVVLPKIESPEDVSAAAELLPAGTGIEAQIE